MKTGQARPTHGSTRGVTVRYLERSFGPSLGNNFQTEEVVSAQPMNRRTKPFTPVDPATVALGLRNRETSKGYPRGTVSSPMLVFIALKGDHT